jgi:hypothetical protein
LWSRFLCASLLKRVRVNAYKALGAEVRFTYEPGFGLGAAFAGWEASGWPDAGLLAGFGCIDLFGGVAFGEFGFAFEDDVLVDDVDVVLGLGLRG